MSSAEQTFVFWCRQEALVGVLAAPQSPLETGMLIIVGGPQYRAGSHRQFVLLARHLAGHGFAVLRFDCRGMGDSAGAPRSFETMGADIGAAIDALLERAPQIRRVVLWGLCDGASAALLYCHETGDPRVGGLCLLNPWIRSTNSLARTRAKHYYVQRALQPEFWVKLLHGRVGAGAIAGVLRNVRMALATFPPPTDRQLPFQHRMVQAWNGFPHDILLLLSGNDYTAKEFVEFASADIEWRTALQHPRLTQHELAGADHTFSGTADRAHMEAHTLAWLEALPTHWKPAPMPPVSAGGARS